MHTLPGLQAERVLVAFLHRVKAGKPCEYARLIDFPQIAERRPAVQSIFVTRAASADQRVQVIGTRPAFM
jgi:hypothetical protein